ncbi:hypothetical protein SBA2_800007 [Acidobacteriia bacterium SbA2]|nr:hypothetical protein SBA2_800007 [Acidobacteriia bacterium SbA2]
MARLGLNSDTRSATLVLADESPRHIAES